MLSSECAVDLASLNLIVDDATPRLAACQSEPAQLSTQTKSHVLAHCLGAPSREPVCWASWRTHSCVPRRETRLVSTLGSIFARPEIDSSGRIPSCPTPARMPVLRW